MLSLQKNHGWPRNWGSLEQNWGGPVPPNLGLKLPLVILTEVRECHKMSSLFIRLHNWKCSYF